MELLPAHLLGSDVQQEMVEGTTVKSDLNSSSSVCLTSPLRVPWENEYPLLSRQVVRGPNLLVALEEASLSTGA